MWRFELRKWGKHTLPILYLLLTSCAEDIPTPLTEKDIEGILKQVAQEANQPSGRFISTKTVIGKDGAEIVLIPAGEFLMGSQEGEGRNDEHPQHVVYLDAFYIDKYEVTNAQYKKFVDTTGHRVPYVDVDWAKPYNWQNGTYPSEKGNHPVVLVSWGDAEAYCKWAGKRLPTEAEWEKAARGTDQRKYPWGNEAPNAGGIWRANYYEPRGAAGFVLPIGSFPAGASPYGVMDMAGNVWEWVADWYDKNYYSVGPKNNPKGPSSGVARVSRGGYWNNNDDLIRAATRGGGDPDDRSNGIGFRCSQDKL